MKVNQLETELSQSELLAQGSFSGIGAPGKEVFTRPRVYGEEEGKLSYWQFIFSQSKTNGCFYRGEDLPHVKWQWPRNTWFQKHLSDNRKARERAVPQASHPLTDAMGSLLDNHQLEDKGLAAVNT